MAHSPNAIAYYRDRCTPPLTQAALARALGIHTNTLQHWERQGAPAPADLLRLVTLFMHAGAIRDYATACEFWNRSGRRPFEVPRELEQLFVASGNGAPGLIPVDTVPPHAPPPPHSRLPFQRNHLFVGRTQELRGVATALNVPDATVVICGMAGIGKTQLACEVAHRYGQYYPGGVFWISFANADTIAAGIASCGGAEHLALRPDFERLPQDQQVRLVLAAWRATVPRLLIFDNCEDEQLVHEWRPVFGGCRVVVTSRRMHWSAALVTHLMPLPVLARPDSIMLLRGHRRASAPHHNPEAEAQVVTALDGIADELGDLPLALHLAGTQMARLDRAPERYLAQLRATLLPGGGHTPYHSHEATALISDHHTIAHAFALSYKQLRPGTPVDALAIQLLARASYFAAGEPIPPPLLARTITPADEPDEMVDAALARLVQDTGLLERGPERTLRMHRLVASFVRRVTTDTAAQAAVEQTILHEARSRNESRAPGPILAIEHHLFAVTDAAVQRGAPLAADLAAEVGWQEVLLQRFEAAQRYLVQSLAIREQVLGTMHPDTATSVNRLGLLHHMRGDLVRAQPFFERATASWEETLGTTHPETMNGYNNLGYLLCQRGDYPAAYAYLRHALAVRRRLFGLCHPETARTINNMGYLLRLMGKPRASRVYLARALEIRQCLLPATSPMIALTLNNLGDTLAAEGKYHDARRCYEQARAIRAEVFGDQSFPVAESIKGLGLIRYREGDYSGAYACLQGALAMCERAVGADHFETAWKYDAVGECLYAQGAYRAARPYYVHALQVYSAQFLPHHPDIRRMRARLSTIA